MEEEISMFAKNFNSTCDKETKSKIVDKIVRNLKIKNSRSNRKRIKRMLKNYKNEKCISPELNTTYANTFSQTDSSISNYVQFGHVHQVSSKMFVAACLSNGIGFTAGHDFSLKLGIKVPALSKCYSAQNQIHDVIHQIT